MALRSEVAEKAGSFWLERSPYGSLWGGRERKKKEEGEEVLY
jgi:hypothetical protein